MANPKRSGCCCGQTAQSDAEMNQPTVQALPSPVGSEVQETDAESTQAAARPTGSEEPPEQSEGRGRGRRSGGCCC